MKRFLALFAMVSLLLVAGCKPDPFLTVSPTDLSFGQDGGSQTVKVSANYPWTASASGTGISVSPSSGEGEATVTITVAGASSTDETSGTVTFRSEGLSASVSVKQDAKSAIVVGDVAKIPAEGGTFKVDIQYNTEYTVEIEKSAQSWITFNGTKAMQSGKMEFTFASNETNEARTGKVTITDKSGKVAPLTITFTQDLKPVIIVGDVMGIPAEGGTFQVDIQYNTDYTVEIEKSAQSWIWFNGTKAMQSGKLEFTFAANDGDLRSGKVTVTDKSGKLEPITLTFAQEPENKIIVVGQVATVPSQGGSLEVDVQYNVDFEVIVETSAASWLHYVKTKTVSSGKLLFEVDENETTDEREGKVTLKAKNGEVDDVTLTVYQYEKKVLIVGEPSKVSFMGGYVTIPVEYNVAYYVDVEESAESWIHIYSTKSTASGEIILYVDENRSEEERTGKVTLIDYNGYVDPVEITIVQSGSRENEIREILMKLYNAWDGPNWKKAENWGTDEPIRFWSGVHFDEKGLYLHFYEFGLKGTIPDFIGDLSEVLYDLRIFDEPGLTGPMPESIGKLVNLEHFSIENTGITTLPDIFGEMNKLKRFYVRNNKSMKGSLPASLHSPVLEYLDVGYSFFTGSIPASWAPYAGFMEVKNNCLTGKISHLFHNSEDLRNFVKESNLWQRTGYGFDISDIEIPGVDYWFEDQLLENLDGTTFSIPEVIKQNKYTVYIYWALWCPFSKELMPQLKDYYDRYKQDGLEDIATIQVDEDGAFFYDYEKQKKECIEKGYDQWYNYYFTKYTTYSYWTSVPNAEVYDQQGNIIFSSCANYPDPVRNRFGKVASSDLIPFLETLLGPAEIPDTYESKDYSKDGEVMTLQKASVGKGIDLVFLGDAYTDKDMGAGGLYETVMKQAMEEFFAIEPYKTFRNRYNVYAVKVVSKNGRIGEGYSTALSTRFGVGSYIAGNNEKCYEYALKVPSITSRDNLLVTVVANSRRHSGTTFMYPDGQTCVAYFSSMANDPSIFGFTLRHESGGHGFGFLADEYTQYSEAATAEHIAYYNDVYDKYGWFANVDFTNDPKKIRWSAFLDDARYDGQVGIFEGGALYAKGAWRPTQNGMMRENLEYFNAPSRWAIYQRIMKLSGEECSFEKFLEYDEVNRKASPSQMSVKPPFKAPDWQPGAPPVIMP